MHPSLAAATDERGKRDDETSSTRQTRERNVLSIDAVEDSFYDPIQADPDCETGDSSNTCWEPPASTIDARASYGGDDPDESSTCSADDDTKQTCKDGRIDEHWGSNQTLLELRDRLRLQTTKRPPIFLLPGLASTRLVAWKYKQCKQHHPLLSDIKVQDYVWLNINLVMQMGTIDVSCMKECLQLGLNQSDSIGDQGCKLRPDEGLDAISSLSPGGIGSQLLVGGTNTVYAWLIQWLADNLGYDVTNIVGLPYDWRLSPDKMESRDGFLSLMRRRMEAAVESNGKPGIMVAHSMGNLIFRYFLEWLRVELREEAYQKYYRQATKRAKATQYDKAAPANVPGWMAGVVNSLDEWWTWVTENIDGANRHEQLWELASVEGDENWHEWIERHIWTYAGLSAPLLGAVNPLRAVISGENMGLPVTDEAARVMEITFGSTHTVNPISTSKSFCDNWNFEKWDEEADGTTKGHDDAKLACLDDIVAEIEAKAGPHEDPWVNFPALKTLLLKRSNWDSEHPMIEVVLEQCQAKEKSPCAVNKSLALGPDDTMSGDIFRALNVLFNETDDPLETKRHQLRESFWDTKVPNILNSTWDRPLIKHVIQAYGVDIPTEISYQYRKSERTDEKSDTKPHIHRVLWEVNTGRLAEEQMDSSRGGLGDLLTRKKPKRRLLDRVSPFKHSGDGSVPYLSLAWAHTWLLHGARAFRYSNEESSIMEDQPSPLDEIRISHRPEGELAWVDGPPPPKISIFSAKEKKFEESSETGTTHPHGTKYKPEMIRFHSSGKSRTTGMDYSTTVIEAIGVEHKETTRNYDILAAVFTDVLQKMQDDFELVEDSNNTA